MSATQEFLERLNHSVQLANASPKENAQAGAVDLMRRAVSLDDAIRTLKLPYTFDLIKTDPDKRAKRQMMASLVVDLLETMRDEILYAATLQYLRSRGLTKEQLDAIFPASMESHGA